MSDFLVWRLYFFTYGTWKYLCRNTEWQLQWIRWWI